MSIQQVKLAQEEVRPHHQEEDKAQQTDFAGCNGQQLLEVVVIELFLRFCRTLRCLLAEEGFLELAEDVVSL